MEFKHGTEMVSMRPIQYKARQNNNTTRDGSLLLFERKKGELPHMYTRRTISIITGLIDDTVGEGHALRKEVSSELNGTS